MVCLSPVHMWDMMTSEEGSRTEPKLLTRRQFSKSWTKTEEGRKQERDTTNIPYQTHIYMEKDGKFNLFSNKYLPVKNNSLLYLIKLYVIKKIILLDLLNIS